MFGTSRDGSNRANFYQDNFEELQILASGKSAPTTTTKFIRCACHVQDTALSLPGRSPAVGLCSPPCHSLSSPVSESPVPRSPLPSSCLCRQKKMTNDPDTQHIGQSGAAEPGKTRLCPEMGRGWQGVLAKRQAGPWPGRDTGTDSWSGGQVASGAAVL